MADFEYRFSRGERDYVAHVNTNGSVVRQSKVYSIQGLVDYPEEFKGASGAILDAIANAFAAGVEQSREQSCL